MSIIKFTFDESLNISVQKEDILFAVILNQNQAGVNTPSLPIDKPTAVGVITRVDPGNKTIHVDTDGYTTVTLDTEYFLFFSKPKRINTSGLLGYYSLTEFRNASKNKAEIFATGAEYAPSSK